MFTDSEYDARAPGFSDVVRSTIARFLGLPLLVVVCVLGVELYLREAYVELFVMLLGAAGLFGGAVYVRAGGQLGRAALLMSAAFFMVVAVLGWHAGGLGAPVLYTLGIAPAFSTLVAGGRVGARVAAASVAIFVGIAGLTLTGYGRAEPLEPEALLRGHAIAGFTLILAVTVVVLHFDRAKDEALAAADQARRAALGSARVKSEFLATMSHEIRTPMHGVLGVSSLLRERDLAPDVRDLVDIVHSSAEGLLVVINDVLDLSALEAGRFSLVEKDFSLSEAIEAVLAVVRLDAEAKGLDLRVDVAAGVPDRMHGDGARVRQILLNLVGNAVRFTERGHVEVRARCQEQGGVSMLRLEVADTGRGIAPEDRDRIFRRFEQVDSSRSRTHGGTGLGLAISQRLAAAMGGAIGVESEPDVGSTFWVEVRVVHAKAPARPSSVPPPHADRTSGLRVLLAEDNPVSLMVSRSMLEVLGCEVRVAEDGRQAVDIAARGDVDVILMDCFMPGLDGFGATREIRALDGEPGKVPIIGFTASTTEEDRAACLAAGMDDIVAKPTTLERLSRALRRGTNR